MHLHASDSTIPRHRRYRLSITVVRGTNDKRAASHALTERLARPDLPGEPFSGELFIGYPIIRTSNGGYAIDALLISSETGIVVFDLIEGTSVDQDYRNRQDDSANKLEAHLKSHPELMNRRHLLIPIHTLSFAPVVTAAIGGGDDYPIANDTNLIDHLRLLRWTDHSSEVYSSALAIIQSTTTIRKNRTRREIKEEGSRGEKLKRLEDEIATLDPVQSRAVIETVNGVQRIRGLAGSGKTIVLALKAAYLHAQHPDWRIAVTFYTRSLRGHFRSLIERFSLHQTGEEPDWGYLRIINAWGSPGRAERDGVYYEFCRTHDVDYFDFSAARRKFGNGHEFSLACKFAIEQAAHPKAIYDVILVDEAQDFSHHFLRLCHAMLDDNKRLIYAYDELQNLSEASLPPPKEIFDTPNSDAHIASDVTNNDIILEKCYRNSRPLLATAHALGFGIYRKPTDQGGIGLVQMFDHASLWEDIGYEREGGELRPGCSVVLSRPERTSPRFLEDHSDVDDLIQFRCFENSGEQADWLIREIKKNIDADELRHDDIIVVNPDPLTTRREVGPIRSRLLEMGVDCHVAGVDTEADTFFRIGDQSVTFTGIFRAKGNEAGMVYVINAQDCHAAARNLATIRNRLFTAITRSKAWIRVLGIGEGMERLIDEYRELKSRAFKLAFTYPTKEQRERLRIIHRDLSVQEERRLRDRESMVRELVRDLKSGDASIEDFDRSLISELKKHVGSAGGP